MTLLTAMKKKNVFIPLIILIAAVFVIIIVLSYTNDSCTYLRKGRDHLYLNDGEHELFWFEGIHSNDPDNIMFDDIKTEFMKFDPDLVLVEGGRDKNIQPSAEQAILHGESSYVAYLAHEDGIACLTTEPSDAYLGQELLGTYDLDDINATLTLLQIKQWQRESEDRPIEFTDMIVGWVRASEERMFDEKESTIDLVYIQDIIEPYIGFRVDDSNWLNVPAESVLNGNTTVHAVWQDRIDLRNSYLATFIEEKRLTFKRIFIMMGFDHAHDIMTELETLFEPGEG